MMRVEVEGGKYVFRTVDGDHRVHVDRHDVVDWVVFDVGSKALIGVLGELEELRERTQPEPVEDETPRGIREALESLDRSHDPYEQLAYASGLVALALQSRERDRVILVSVLELWRLVDEAGWNCEDIRLTRGKAKVDAKVEASAQRLWALMDEQGGTYFDQLVVTREGQVWGKPRKVGGS